MEVCQEKHDCIVYNPEVDRTCPLCAVIDDRESDEAARIAREEISRLNKHINKLDTVIERLDAAGATPPHDVVARRQLEIARLEATLGRTLDSAMADTDNWTCIIKDIREELRGKRNDVAELRERITADQVAATQREAKDATP